MKVHQLLEAKELSVSLEARVKQVMKAAIKEYEVPDIGRFTCSPYPGRGDMFKVDVACFSDAIDPAEIADLHDDPEIRKKLKAKVDAARSKRMQNIIEARKKVFQKILDFAQKNGVREVGLGTGRKAYVRPDEVNFDDVSWSAQEVRFSLMFPNELRGAAFNLTKERERIFELLSKDEELKKKYIIDNGYSGTQFRLNAKYLKAFIEKEKEQVDFDINRYIEDELAEMRRRPHMYGSGSTMTPEKLAKAERATYDYTKASSYSDGKISSLQCLTQYLVITVMGKEILEDLKAAIARIDHLTPAKLGAKLEEKRPIWLHHHDHTIARVTVAKPKYEKENYKGS